MSIAGTESLPGAHGTVHASPTPETPFIERGVCPICDSVSFDVLREAQYPANLSREDLLSMYRSSSDHALMDQLVSCSGCGLVYLNPRVAKEIALASYTSAVDPRFVKQNDTRIRTFKRTLDAFTRKYGITPSKDVQILDVGCAGGAFVKAAVDAGFSAIGIEPSSWMCEYGRTEYGLDLRQGILEDFTFADQSFDIITLWDVLEHVYTPVEVLRECHRLLKPGGLLIVNYPDYASLARKVLGWKWPFFLSCHLFYFTPSSITKLLTKCGLEVVEVRTFFQTLEFGYVLERATPYFSMFGWLSRLVKAVGLGALPMTYNMGQSKVVARKHA
jgi:2-polyprenyl-3-methyl-5-hydroxy-6-metoxy-1,4-benzoquinol methylase